MTIYDVTIDIDDRDAPGLRPVTDAIYEAMIKLGARDGYLDVQVKGPPELRIEVVQ